MRKLLYPALLAGLFLATACNPKYYSANSQNVPLIREKGQTNLTLAGNGDQVEFQGAHGVGNHVALQVNGGLFIPKDADNGNGGSGKFLEGGLGYFTPVGESFVFETYGLLGVGSVENHLPSTVQAAPGTTGDLSAGIFRAGIQPNFGFVSRYFSAAVSSRFVSLNYHNVEGSLIFEGEDQVRYLQDNNSYFLIEPALTLRGGFEKFKLQLQLGTSINVTDPDFEQDDAFLTLGLNFNF